jgi:predicted  nucleic acid-binding Zn-ribbon protein
MQAQLTKLLELQAKDLTLLETDLQLGSIIDELGRLDGQVEAAQHELVAARTRVADAVKKREEIEVRIDSYRTIQDRRRQRLEGARGAKEAQALLTEVEMARTVLVREEAEWLRAADKVQELERGQQAAETRLDELRASQTEERQRLQAEQARLSAEREVALADREACAAALEKSVRMRYDRLRSVRPRAVVVPLRGDACGACYTAVPRNRRSQIRAGVLLDNCEACGVILYAADDPA